jgi:hypothetical protein
MSEVPRADSKLFDGGPPLNADHWAVAVPISRTHPMITSMFVTQNAYPREALLEALLRFVEEDLATPSR